MNCENAVFPTISSSYCRGATRTDSGWLSVPKSFRIKNSQRESASSNNSVLHGVEIVAFPNVNSSSLSKLVVNTPENPIF